MLPTFFVAHGAPSLALEANAYTDFLGGLAREWPDRYPKAEAIVLFTAHWEHRVQRISAVERYEMIYDFSGFPDGLYQVRYPAQGHPELAEEIRGLLQAEGIPAELDTSRGLDHGSWVPLSLLFPDARIPVVQMSVHPGLVPEEQYRIGRALSGLRRRNVLVLGSGGTVHNLWRVQWGASSPEPWAVAFDDWLGERLELWDTDSLFAYREAAPHALDAVPRNEHFIPLLYAMGAADPGECGGAPADGKPQAKQLFRDYQYGSLSLSFWEFGG